MAGENRYPSGTSVVEGWFDYPDKYRDVVENALEEFQKRGTLKHWAREILSFVTEKYGMSEDEARGLVDYFYLKAIRDLGALRFPVFYSANGYVDYMLNTYFGGIGKSQIQLLLSKTYAELKDIIESKTKGSGRLLLWFPR